jgi:hypothetical protein
MTAKEPAKDEVGSPAEYHVVGRDHRWDVERNCAFTGVSVPDCGVAINEAIRMAAGDHHRGLDATVCIEEVSGCRHLWP